MKIYKKIGGKKMKKARLIALLITLVMVFGLVAACGPTETPPPAPGPDPQPPATTDPDEPDVDEPGQPPAVVTPPDVVGETHLIVVQPMLPTNLDPTLANEVPGARFHSLVYSTLVYQDANLNIIPGLAETWEFIDAQTVIFNLRPGVLFHNGAVLTAEDVAFSLNRAGESPHVSAITGFIQEVTAIDDLTVQVRAEYAFAPLLNHLAHQAASIVNKAHVMEVGDEAHGASYPVGTGPFMLNTFVTGDHYILDRFDGFNSVKPGLAPGTLPTIERITFRVVPEPGVRTIELETGAAHINLDTGTAEVARIREHPTLVMYEVPDLSLNSWLGFNHQRAPFDDIRVRQAIAYVLDLATVVDVAWDGLGVFAQGPLATTVWGAQTFPPRAHNIERARELMAEAGLEDGFSTDIWTNEGNAMRAQAATMIQHMLQAINIDAEVRIYEWATLLPATAAGEHGMSIMGWVSVTGDPDYGLYPTMHTDNHGEAGNRNFFSNARVDELLIEGRTNTDPAVRYAIYAEAQQIIMDELAFLPMWQGANLHATVGNVGGFNVTPAGIPQLWTVYIT
jgi:peptide/nickel transport system substrate-binding protein